MASGIVLKPRNTLNPVSLEERYINLFNEYAAFREAHYETLATADTTINLRLIGIYQTLLVDKEDLE